ncbi:MAG: GTP 3',8-cyclase MoaA [Phycisphaeraceae bacterium]
MSVALPILDTQPVRPDYAQGPRTLAAVQLLRISVTDRCNLRCIYCMPDGGVPFEDQSDLLSADDLTAVAAAAHAIGVEHFKVTGGEPTIRKDVLQIISGIAELGVADLSMTTNAMTLDRLATPLRDAGLDRLTISWDSMQPQKFNRITGGRYGPGGLSQLRRGIDAAVGAGFERLKINVVVIGGINDDEVVDFAMLSLDRPWTVRFIEYMPLGDSVLVEGADHYTLDNAAVAERIQEALGELTPMDGNGEPGVGPAKVFALPGAVGRVGFISAMSRPFCETCNRLRLTATGELRSCLFDGGEVGVLEALRPTPDPGRLVELMRQCVALKPEVHSAHGNRQMSQMGG